MTEELYLDLLARSLTDSVYEYTGPDSVRSRGQDIPKRGFTAIGVERLENIRNCAQVIFEDEIPGDFMECGVWRGGACIYMRGLLKNQGVKDRTVWLADTFNGFPSDVDEKWAAINITFSVSEEQVRFNFMRYGLLDHQVKLLPGDFSETLPGFVGELALLRLDADAHRSTMDALKAMYPKVSPGGFVIADDYLNIAETRNAVDEYREKNGITAPLQQADWCAVYWRKP